MSSSEQSGKDYEKLQKEQIQKNPPTEKRQEIKKVTVIDEERHFITHTYDSPTLFACIREVCTTVLLSIILILATLIILSWVFIFAVLKFA